MKLKKVFLALGVVSALALAVLVVLPLLFRDRIGELVKRELAQRVDARVEWRRVRVSLLRDFPNATVRLERLTVAGVGRFEGDTLASVHDFRLVLDLRSVLAAVRKSEQLVIRSVAVDAPVLNLRVLPDGTANWRITKARAASTQERGTFHVALRGFEVRNGRVVLDNQPAKVYASLDGVQHSLSGDFTRDRSILQTRTRADQLTMRFAGVPYLSGVRLDARAAVDADLAQRKFSFRDNVIRLNELVLGFSGSVQQREEQLALDVELMAPRTEFRHILSLVPAVYARDFETLQTGGGVSVAGHVTGVYGDSAFPAFALHARVDSAQFRYPDLPLPARNIFAELSIDNPGQDVDRTVVQLKRFQVDIGGERILASMALRTPVSDPEVELHVEGKLDLAEANRTFKLGGIQELSGVVAARVSLATRMSDLDLARYDRVVARGAASIRNLNVRAAKLPHRLAIAEAHLDLAPARAELTSFTGTIGSSDVQLDGVLENVLGFVLRHEDLRGTATLRSRQFVLDEWQRRDATRRTIPVPPRLDFTLAATIDRLRHDELELSKAHGTVQLKDRRLSLTDFRFNTLGGAIALNGFYETADTSKPTFDVKLAADNLDIPGAFAQFVTVQRLAPVAQYTEGRFSADMSLTGALGSDLTPLFDVLSGQGSVHTSRLALREFPAMNRLADGLRLQQLKNPQLDTIASTFEIRNGRLHAQPFEIRVGDTRMKVSGSNGVDQSLQYTIAVEVPRAALGTDANRVVTSLIAQTGRTGINVQPRDVVQLAVQLTGTVRDPAIRTNFTGVATATRDGLGQAVARELERRAEATGQRAGEAKAEARRRAQAEAERLVREAEQRAATVREEAAALAATVRREGNERADELLARATNPVARTAARPAADRLRKEADDRAAQIVREADARANAIVLEARKKAESPQGE